ncbi:MAG: FN3 associated domain-containing protein [Flavobacteriaceae bacterium]
MPNALTITASLLAALLISLEVSLSTSILGNFHPLLVHLPIGIFLFGFALEIYVRLKKYVLPSFIQEFILLIAAFFALLSIGSGLVLGEGGGYEEAALKLHRNMGIAFGIGASLLYVLFKKQSSWSSKIYMPLYSLLVILMSLTGHYGGNMTHGDGFLFGTQESLTMARVEDLEQAMVYNDLVKPLLEVKCVGCHSASKTKGGLIMTSKEMLLKGGENGPIFSTVTDPVGTLITRIHLDLVDKLHMPPKSKVQLSDQEIALLDWWMENNFCFDCKVSELPKAKKISLALLAFKKDDSPLLEWGNDLDPVPASWIQELLNSGISVYPIAADNPLLIANTRGRQNLGESDFKLLKKYAANIIELNLSNSNMNDTLAVFLPTFKNLTKLQISHTDITDSSLQYIVDLNYLGSFNAFNTTLTAKALESLGNMKSLKKAYLTDTQIGLKKMNDFSPKNQQLVLQYISEDVFAQTAIDPPTIITDTDFFKDQLVISLAYVFDNASLYYTLDGSIPDTTSNKYAKPFVINKTTQLKAVTYMDGWGLSELAVADFKKSALYYKDIQLLALPNEKYAANGGKSLVDLKRGSTNFVDGMWLGFEGVHSGVQMSLQKKESIHSVSVGALSAPASWIFFPAAIEVYSAADGKNYQLISKKSFAPIDPTNELSKKFFDISIPETQTQYLKIVIKSPLTNPDWHPNPGGKSWLFIDEIIIE